MNKNSKIYVAGHNGMVGSSILRILKKKNFKNIIVKSKKELDLRNQLKTNNFFKKNKPEYVFVASAKVGGIHDNILNSYDFLSDNLQIQNNLIIGAFENKVKNLLFLGSSCAYPINAKKPLKENSLFTGKLEPTNETYAMAKLTGMKLCYEIRKKYKYNYKSLIPCNLYGPNDNFDLRNSHFFPALINKAHNCKKKNKILNVWGDGKPKRELMFVDDLADACIYFINKKIDFDYLNIGTGKDYSINFFAKQILKTLDIKAKLKHDFSKPKGISSKVLDISKSKKLGWSCKTPLEKGLIQTYDWFVQNK